ncbi:MAG: hypothetical protein NTV86_19710, partial [Planctomycetota bacterium]|nr:hypothetical protein [Planctomycetota bacterium]
DASVGLVYDTVGARQTERANHETRTETFTSAVAVGRDQAAKLAKSTGAARLKIAAMGAMETELKDIEREVGALRDQYVKDYQTIETYNEKPAQEAPGAGTAGGADISPAAVRKLAEEVKAVTAAAQESTASAQRVTGEQERGQLKPEALARQYKLIVDRLAETEGKYKAVGGTYRQMTAALPGTDGADAAVDIESVRRHALDTLATIRSRTDVAQSVVDRYCRTADELTSLIGPHEEFQNAFSRGIDYFRDNGDFKPGSNDYADLTEIRDRVMSECRLDAGEISQRVGRAKELRAQADRLGREGQGDVPAIKKPAVAAAAGSEPAGEGVRKLAPAVTKMDDAVKTARDAVAKLGDLAGRLAPVRRDIASTLPPRVQRNPLPDEQMDTISLKQLRELTGLEGHGSQDDPHPELFGYTWHHYDSERNKQAGDPNSTPVPYMNGYCRLAEKGTVRVWIDSNQNGKQDKGEDLRVYPYWIWYTFWGSASDCYWYGRNRQGKNVRTLVSLADWQKHMDRVEPLNVPRADFAVLGTSVNRFSNPQSSGTVTRMQGFAGAGAITVEVCVNVNFQVGWTYLPTETRYNNEKRWLYFEDESAVDRNVSFWMTGREPHIREILYQATTVAADFEEHSRDHYVYDAQPLLPTLEGFTAKGTEYDKNNGIHTNPYRNFERKGSFQYSMGKTVCTAQWGERYYVGVSIEGVDGSRSWRQVMESLYQRCQTPSLPKSTAFTPAVPGAGKIVGVRTAYGSHIGSGARAVLRHTVDERVLFVKRNVRVQVDGYGYSLAQPHLLTAQLAQSVAAAIDRQPK